MLGALRLVLGIRTLFLGKRGLDLVLVVVIVQERRVPAMQALPPQTPGVLVMCGESVAGAVAIALC
jgi:hypothetical protein